MKGEIPPVEVSDLVPFSSSLNSSYASKASESSFSGISKNGLWMWVVYDTVINLYHTENGEWFGGHCFGETLKNPAAKISTVTEFCSNHVSFPCLLIAVNHDHESLICLYDINISKVIRAVLVPDTVLTIEVISGNGGACIETLHLFMQLRYMFGIVAVGTSSGHLYFLDLCLDEDFACNEMYPNITFITKKYELLPERREMAIAKEQHIFMLLNDQSVRNGSFEFESRSSSLGHFPHGKVHVSALKYIPSTVSLAMGFNFGGIQLWDLQDLCLLYTVSNQPQELPIIAFAFQEPENDPRHFCYLWIIRGHSANERPEDFSTATMYSLIYDKRTYVESFGYLYTDLRNCTKRFEYRLTSDPFSAAQSSSTAGSCLLSCQTVCQTDESHLDAFSANDSNTAPENMSLCFLSWLVWSNSDNTPSSYHLALFDLNQWYRAEMPSSNLRSEPTDLNPYFAHFSLEEVAQVFDLEPLLGLYVVPHSIKKFRYISPSEEFFFPSSLDFQTFLYSTNGICKTSFMGLQKRILYEIADMGSNVLANPKDFFSDLIRSGLIPDTHCSSERVPLIVQRETLLQLALEYHMPFFFMKCLQEWRYADSIQEGCTSRALLSWAWKKVIQIKSSIDKLSIPLFNCSGSDVDKAPLKCLYSYRRQLDLIDTIFMGYQKFATPRTEQGMQELKCRKDVVFSINTYLQVILWLRSIRVLPEVCEGEETDKNVLYPINTLNNSYMKRRNILQKIHGSIGPTDILLIDGLIKEAFSENTWQEKGGNGIYPPPSIYAALSCYLLDDVPLELKHSLMYYLLLDICNTPYNITSPFIAELKKFPSIFGLSQSVSKLIKAFWYLDQFNFEVAIKKLLDPSVKASDILPWQHHRIIKSFLYQREAGKALKYVNHMEPPENTIEDLKLHLSVLLARGAVIQAFYYQRNKQNKGFGMELLCHLFRGCQEMHKLKDLMYLPLNTFESSALIKFLSESEDLRAQEALVMYYLLHCNFYEAAKVNEKLSMNVPGKSLATRERTAGRDALVEGFLASVPKTEKNLVEEINRFPSHLLNKTEVLKPLSLSVKNVPLKQIAYSDILNSLISEVSSSAHAHYLDPQTPLKSMTSFENVPFLRPPLTPERTQISSEKFHSTPVIKRTLTSPSSEFSSPSKKSRLLDNAPFRTVLSKKKIPKHLAGDVASLLQSPPIPRRSSKQIKDVFMKDTSEFAPQGILKKKLESSKFPISDVYTSKTPSVLSDAEEDSDDENVDDNEMIVEETSNDVPGRQIRFSVPNKENLNIFASSSEALESPLTSDISNKPSSFIKKLEELKSIPALKPLESDSGSYINVTRRQTLPSLTREPLNAHSRDTPEKPERHLFPDRLESYKLAYEKSYFESPKTSVSLPEFHQRETKESQHHFDTDSDSCSAPENMNNPVTTDDDCEFENDPRTSAIPVQSSGFSPVLKSALNQQKSNIPSTFNVSGSDFALNRSSSSSGNSSYNSAVSERSFIITPRRPLRDGTRNTSFIESTTQESKKETIHSSITSMVQESMKEEALVPEVFLIQETHFPEISTVEGNRRETTIFPEISMIQENIKEVILDPEIEMINVDDEDNCSGDEEDISIIGEVAACRSEDIHPVEQSNEERRSLQDISMPRTTTQFEEISSCVQEVEKYYPSDINFASEDREVSHAVELARNCPDLASYVKTAIIDVPGENEFPVQSLEEVTEGTHNYPSLEKEKSNDPNVDVTGELITDSEVKQIENVTVNFITEAYDFAREVPISSLPAYVPIKERSNDPDVSTSVMTGEHISDSEVKQIENVPKNFVETHDFAKDAPMCSLSTYVPLKERSKDHNVSTSVMTVEHISDSEIKQIENMPENVFAEMHDFAENAPISSLSTYVPLKERSKDHDVSTSVITGEQISDSEVKQIENVSKHIVAEMHDFAKKPTISTLPAYVPLKERISRSHQSVSVLSKRDDEEGETNPSLLLQEQMDLEKSGEVFESENANILEENPFDLKPAEKLEMIAEKSLSMDIDSQATQNSPKSVSPPILTSTKDFSEKLSERFDFLSRNSDFYENNKLYRETMNLLKERDLPPIFEYDAKKISARKTRNFVFEKSDKVTETEVTDSKSKTSDISSAKGFLESWQPESYEQFSFSIQKGRSDEDQKATLKSSPARNEESVSEVKESKKQESIKKDTSVDKKKKSSIRNSKGKGKTTKKTEFSFAEPHSPAGPEILEALTTPSQYPVGSFMFSPPLTRGRLRKKKMDETFGSSFVSNASETSFVTAKKPPVDSILEGIMAERAPESKTLLASKSRRVSKSTKKKTVAKKTAKTDVLRFELSDDSINLSKLVEVDSPNESTSTTSSPSKQVTRHKMVLRQTKGKSRTAHLF